jgi:micrococcal nuclease
VVSCAQVSSLVRTGSSVQFTSAAPSKKPVKSSFSARILATMRRVIAAKYDRTGREPTSRSGGNPGTLFLICSLLAWPAQAADGWTNYDGDSLRTPSGERIRVKGIDTPEIKGACAYERRLAAAAREFAAGQLRRAERVTLVRHGHDRYGRTLAYVLVDGKDFGDELVSRGLARVWTGRRLSWCQ